MLNQSQIRAVWAPPCRGPWVTVPLYGAGKVSVRPAAYNAVQALNQRLAAHGYRTRAVDTGGYVCRRTTNSTSYSTHAYGIAIDINWQSNPYGSRLVTNMPRAMVDSICAIRTNNGKQVWNWGGFWRGNKDAMHFEIVCSPADLATGIRGGSTPPAPASAPTPIDWAAVRRLAAADLKNRVAALPNLNGSSPQGQNVKTLQQALNFVSGAKLTEDGDYGPATIRAVLAFQSFMNGIKAGTIKDFPGAAHDGTRWMLCTALDNISKGKA